MEKKMGMVCKFKTDEKNQRNKEQDNPIVEFLFQTFKMEWVPKKGGEKRYNEMDGFKKENKK